MRSNAREPVFSFLDNLKKKSEVTALQIRADNIGSLLRPPELLEAREASRKGKIGHKRLREIEDRSILKASICRRPRRQTLRQSGVDAAQAFEAAIAADIFFERLALPSELLRTDLAR